MKNKISINGKEFTIDELNELIENSQKITKEQRFLELFQGLEIKSDIEKYPDSVFFFRGDEFILEIKNSHLWVSYTKVWRVFKDEFHMNYSETKEFIKDMVEKHFKWKGLTTGSYYYRSHPWVEKPLFLFQNSL